MLSKGRTAVAVPMRGRVRLRRPMQRYFAGGPNQPRARRVGDVTALVVGLSLVIWTAVNADRVAAVELALVDLARSFPSWLDQLYSTAYFIGFVLVIGLVLAVLGEGRKRLDLLRDIGLAAAGSLLVGMLLVWWLGDPSTISVFPEFRGDDVGPVFPMLRVALLTSAVVVASPHLARPIRRFAWAMVLVVGISGFGLGFGLPSDAVGGFGIGIVVASLVLIGFGSPKGFPDVEAIRTALGDLGVMVHDLVPLPDRSWGVQRLLGTLDDGNTIEVKTYARDATDSQVFAKAWQTLWYREGGQVFHYSRLHAVEHEALSLMVARKNGVGVPDVLRTGLGGDDMALLVTDRQGKPMPDGHLPPALLLAAWSEVDALHRVEMSHGSLTIEAFAVADGEPIIRNFALASFNAGATGRNLDIVSFLYSTAVEVGIEPAVSAAVEGVGSDALSDALPFLQTPALTRSQRRLVESPKRFIAELREAVATATSVELPQPAKLRRVKAGDLVMPALSLLAVYALLSLLTDIDFAAVWDVMQSATWIWVVVGFAVAQIVFVFEAFSMLYATGHPLPLKPLTILQVSVKWIGLAVPSAAGRVTMNALFLRKYGVSPTIAVTQGAIDGIAGFFVEALIIVVALITVDLSLEIDTPGFDWAAILLVVIGVIAVSVIAVLRVQRLRDSVVPVVVDAWNLLLGVLKDPLRALGLLGANLASRTILAVALWFILQAIGTPLPLAVALVVTVATNLLAGLVPIPGGIGVAEAALTSFLVLAGLDPDGAFAAAVVFRVATFYIPAAEGFFAMKWLERADYL